MGRLLIGKEAAEIAARADDAPRDDDDLRTVTALARMAEALLSCGAPAADVTALTLRAALGAGLAHTQVDITFTAVIVSAPDSSGTPLTAVRVVQVRATDYSRLAGLYQLAHDAAEGMDPDVLRRRLRVLLRRPRRYRPMVAHGAVVGLAFSVGWLLGGGLGVSLAAGATSAVLQLLLAAANRRGLPAFFQQVAGAATATLVAVALLVYQPTFPDWLGGIPPSLVVGAGIVPLLAGLFLVGSAEDAIAGFYVTASGRAFETMLLTTGIVVGIAGVLDLAQRGGVPLDLQFSEGAVYPLGGQVAAAAAASMTWALAGYADLRAVLCSGLAGGALWLLYSLGLDLGLGPISAAGLAALGVGFLAEGLAWRWGIPGVVVSICGIVPLLPGLAIYRAIFSLVGGDPAGGVSLLVQALGVALALAAGVTLGEFCSQPLRREFDRVERAVRRRARNPQV